jgi:hypothetical protein
MNNFNDFTMSRWFWQVVRFVPEDDAVSAETCSRYLVNDTNIQMYVCIFSGKIDDKIVSFCDLKHR